MAVVLGSLVSGVALALPPEGNRCPNARVADADGHIYELKAPSQRPALVLYEDKSSSRLNLLLKNELTRLSKSTDWARRVDMVAVADVSGYDFWPVRGFVKDAIREESRKYGTTIYCDWDGRFRSALGLVSPASNVILVGRDGRILFARHGRLSEAEVGQLMGLLRAQVTGDETEIRTTERPATP